MSPVARDASPDEPVATVDASPPDAPATATADVAAPATGQDAMAAPADRDQGPPAIDGHPADVPTAGDGPPGAAGTLVASLDFERFREDIKALSCCGDRTQGSASFDTAAMWLEQQLTAAGYAVEHEDFQFMGGPRRNIFVTKVGTRSPDRMYIVSGHLDGRGAGGGADDDGSGVALVLEVARALARPDVETDVSIRFAFWDNEETGEEGSSAYIRDRGSRQGVEDPPGSHRYPEPRWLGVIQHDMILFDHGLPPGPMQAADADIDVEYQASSKLAAESQALAAALAAGNRAHAQHYPVEVGPNMSNTDSRVFQDLTAAVSVREDQRISEIGRGSNPHWHKPTDVFTTYSDADFHLGFATLQTTLGTIADLAGAHLTGH
jgi:hypothetical protein